VCAELARKESWGRRHNRLILQAGYQAAYATKHRDYIKAARAEWYRAHREAEIARAAQWGKDHPKAKRAIARTYYVAHREEILAKRKAAWDARRKAA
jgi:hypothetical protein